MAIETLAARTGATPLRIRRVQKITLTLLFIAGIVNFLDRSSLSVAGEAIRADLGLSATEFGCCSPPFRSLTASRNCPPVFCWIAWGHGLCWAPG
ncbi:D-galactonate transporter [Klebsiella pneumoniae]|nr:D-galactonate transporter [Klebsiella pneumoniae]